MILIALGANLPSRAGAPDATLRAALAELSTAGVNILSVSHFYRSTAWPDPRGPVYVNAVTAIATQRSAESVLALLHATEDSFGRLRTSRNAPRTLDLDLIDYDGRTQEGPPRLPHPRVQNRNFVLIPLRDVAPDWVYPVSGQSISQLIEALPEEERTLALW